ncbi:MAG: insulinase family protein, partial [Bacteroidales bacterium]|nr:insulinase family protein [Bacteroidales bacterium]
MKRFILLMAAFVLAVTTVFAQQELPNDPETRVGKLENGFTYYIRHNDQPAQRAEFYLASNVGAIQETPEQDGLAHFLEHMCFNGTENFPDKTILDYLQSIGAEFGRNVNAATGVETTEYMLNNIPVIREGIVDTCLLIMHDYAHYVTNDPVEIDKERGVIIEEKRTRNTASWRSYIKSQPYLYGDSKYADCSLIGSEENLLNFAPETLVEFYHTWYRPDLQAIIVVGDIDVDAVEEKIKALFSTIPMPEEPQPKANPEVPGCEEPRIGIITDPENVATSVAMYWKINGIPRELRSTNVAFMNDLFQTLVYYVMAERFGDIAAKPDAPFLRARMGMGSVTQTCDVAMVNTAVQEGKALEGFKAAMTEVERMKRFGFTAEEFNRAKDELLSELEKDAEAADTRKNAEFIQPILSNFFDNELFLDPKMEYELSSQVLAMVNVDVLNQYVGALIPENDMVIIYEAPEKEGLEHPTEADFLALLAEVKAAEIEANEEESFNEPLLDPEALAGAEVTETEEGLYGSTIWTLGNGVKVVALPTQYKKDQIIIQIRKDGGRSLLADEDLASFDANVMSTFERNAGLSKFPKTTLDKMLSGVKVNMNFSLGAINHSLSANCPPKDLEKAFQLLYLKYTDPRFDEDEYAVGRNMLASIIPNYVTTPDYAFMKELSESRYGAENPRNVLFSEETLDKASLEAYARVYKEVLFPDAAGVVVYVVGNFEVETLKPLVEKYIGSLPKGENPTTWNADNVLKVQEGKIVDVFETTMEAPKSTVYQIKTMDAKYSVKDEVVFDAVDYIIQMIYTDTLREDEGGTYGAGTSCRLTREPFEKLTFIVAFDTKPESSEKLRQMAVDEFEKFATEGPSDEYFARTVENFKKNIPESRISNNYWLSNLSNYVKYGEDFDALFEAAVESLTAEEVKAAAQFILSSENWIEVVMMPKVEEVAEEAASEEV